MNLLIALSPFWVVAVGLLLLMLSDALAAREATTDADAHPKVQHKKRPHRLAGLGHRAFNAVTRVRIPLGTPPFLRSILET